MADGDTGSSQNYSIEDMAEFVAKTLKVGEEALDSKAPENRILDVASLEKAFSILKIDKDNALKRMITGLLQHSPNAQATPTELVSTFKKLLQSCDLDGNGFIEGSEIKSADAAMNAIAQPISQSKTEAKKFTR